MNKAKREALEQAGFQICTVQEFLGLSDWENRLVQLKVMLSKTVKRYREAQHLTQKDIAVRIKSSQSRIAKIEAGVDDVSLDLQFRYLFAVGGKLEDLEMDRSATAADAEPIKGQEKNASASRRKRIVAS